VVQKSEASAYFCLYVLNALTDLNKIAYLSTQFIRNVVMNKINTYSLTDATKMIQLANCFFTS